MPKYIIVTDQKIAIDHKDYDVLSPREFIQTEHSFTKSRKVKTHVINLCNKFDYLSLGYYISLLAEARGFLAAPSIENIVTLNWKRYYQFAFPEINGLLKKHLTEIELEPSVRTYTTFFGRHQDSRLEPITRRLFDLFRFPVLKFEIKHSREKNQWIIERIESDSIANLPQERLAVFVEMLEKYTGNAWKLSPKDKKVERFWLAMLHNPQEKMPPSNKAALAKFIKIGSKMGLSVEAITKKDSASLLEYDALFIRETTAINNHTYRFAAKAEQEGIPCIDDANSIIKCCNKVFLQELFQTNNVPVPKTCIIDRKRSLSTLEEITFPAVLKIPDGSFSRGVFKAADLDEFKTLTQKMLKQSEIILCQEFLPSTFDWRIGVLGQEPLFGIQYFMAENHWQIYNHNASTNALKAGGFKAFKIQEIPTTILSTAIKAANLIGHGLYGVDLKQMPDGNAVVIEVNDNPNIDSGVEDAVDGELIYQKIFGFFIKKIRTL